ncbi:MAG: M4 family metallopeptidase [Gammaproteobacteria bacterium]|nr:M4 family metallopeptidase [Gammaproteobacteria bacterium]
MKRKLFGISLLTFLISSPAFSATPIDLSHQPVSTLRTVLRESVSANATSSSFKQLSVHLDQNQTAHIRVQQMIGGYPVWGGDAVLHVAKNGPRDLKSFLASNDNTTQMNGTIYRGVQSDLMTSPANAFSNESADRALKSAIKNYSSKINKSTSASESKTIAMVFVDSSNKAHWAWLVSFNTKNERGRLAMPKFIIDAITGEVYKQWDNVQTILVSADGGGYGGNPKTGKFTYDGLKADLTSLRVLRDPGKGVCFLQDKDVVVKDLDKAEAISQFQCMGPDSKHKVFWDGTLNKSNGAFSPDNDALFIGDVIQKMYRDWYNVPALTKDGKPMLLVMRTHDTQMSDNAYWDGQQMTFGNGDGSQYYPFVSMTVGAHEISHGFTEQHSNLQYEGQSGGLNESFSDMASMAAEFYAYGKSSWLLGWEIPVKQGAVIRYMDQPSKDCPPGRKPGNWCSIDKASQYFEGLDVHFSSGVFNRAYYLLSTSANWTTRKAFDVMVKANQDYWTSTTTFQDAACGVVKAAKDLKYDLTAVNAALKAVDLDPTKC